MSVQCKDYKCPRFTCCNGRNNIPAKYAGTKCSIQSGDHTVEHGKDIIRKHK